MTSPSTELAGRSVLVMGLGSFGGGLGATRFLLDEGARVTVTDLRSAEELEEGLAALKGRDVRFVLGEHRSEDFETTDLIVPNPAVPSNNKYLKLAEQAGIQVVSEVELFLQRCPARIVAVTGTQGKSSTASILAQLLTSSGYRVHLGGNIGGSLLGELDTMKARDICVLELSSYQLDALSRQDKGNTLAGRADVIAITNILSDHLERHGTREAYAQAKLRVLELLDKSGSAILPSDVCETPGVRQGPWRVLRVGPEAEVRLEAGEFHLGVTVLGQTASCRLPGYFQLENTLVALVAANCLGAPNHLLREAIARLEGLEHRLQHLGRVRGRTVWDNGVSTTPDSTASALKSMEGSCVLLCGGSYKQTLSLDVLVEAAKGRVFCAVTFGADAPVLSAAFLQAGIPTRVSSTLADAVEVAFTVTRPQDALLFSPACASFDAYRNYRERALEFRNLLKSSV